MVIVSRGPSSERLAEAVCRKGGNAVAMHADAADFYQVGWIFDAAVERFGRVDVVVNGSGGNRGDATVSNVTDFVGMDPAVPVAVMGVNYLSKRYSLQHFARYLLVAGHEGSAINITSMSGIQPLTKVIDYSAAYAAVENLTRSVAYLFARSDLGRVNNLAVGFTVGEQNRQLLVDTDGHYTPRAQEILTGISQGRFLDPGEIGPHVLYLADSERSSVINGHTLRVDGGFSLVGLTGTAGYTSQRFENPPEQLS
jgi:NAD(P)-dependent dehydrogenase (short-subunit alcohol dehydrogenase family)